ncbi:MAG: CDP-diacylglycerol--glycerol-3-phosphate 3-phosphatidyltransferase [Puniceicoccales bacterium]|nr:CDP-diacylglycerol--glycerol-3-phosphate 3-phosphatidyltransferase [Puniceicoccales bacterium]
MNIANWVTLSRIPFLFLIVFFLYLPLRFSATLGFVLFVLAALTDWYDGYLARRYGLVSAFGKLMDALSDKILMLGLWITILALPHPQNPGSVGGMVPRWALFPVLLILAREFLITGLRLIASAKAVVLAAENLGKIKTVAQIFSTGFFILWYALVRDGRAFIPECVGSFVYGLAMGLFILSTYLTIDSGIRYLVKHRQLLLQAD